MFKAAMLDAMWIDIRHSFRCLRRSPGFSLVVTATFALAIGANTTVFSLLNAIVLRAVSVSDPDRLVAISTTDTRTTQPGYIYVDALTAFRAQQRSFSTLSMYSGGGVLRIEARSAAVDAGVEGVMPEYFALVGARLAAGRSFTEGDSALAGAATPAVVITDRLWRRIFGGDSRAVGEAMRIDGKSVTIVGVTAPGFYGLQVDAGADLFLPLSILRTLAGDPRRPVRALNVIGRLAPGVTLKQARAEVLARWPAIQAATLPSSLSPAEQSSLRSQRVVVESLATGFSVLRRQYGTSLVVLVGLTAILLAIGCVNLTGLLLARGLARQQQIAVRVALGAGPARLFQQLLFDGLLLALCGLAAALPLAWWSSHVLSALLMVGRITPLLRPMTPDGRVLAIATFVAIVTGLLIGILPAWRAVNSRVDGDLPRGRVIAGTLGRSGRLLLVAQVALSMVLLAGAGLFTGTLSHLHANDAPLRTRRIVWTRLARNPGDRGTTLGRPYFQELLRQLSGIPGVDAAAFSFIFPAFLGFASALPTDSFAPVAGPEPSLVTPGLTEFVSPGFFDMFGIARLRGRDFTWDDDGHAPTVAIVSETLARKLFPASEVTGRRIRVSSGAARTDVDIIGVVADAPIGSIREPHQAIVFRPMLQDLTRAQSPMAHVRVSGDLKGVRDAYVRVVESQGHHFVRGLFTLDEWIDYALLQERLIAGLSTSAAALAVVLACLGIYGLLAYTVTSRVREIGVRMALGATRTAVVQMIVREGLTVAVAGVLIGIPCALAAAGLVRSQLYGLAPNDHAPIIGAAVVFIVTGFVAALVPAFRASKIDPMDALRHE
jgi:predicted permease